MQWLDDLVANRGGPGIDVFIRNKVTNMRIPGVYHQLESHQHSAIEGDLSDFSVWNTEWQNANKTEDK